VFVVEDNYLMTRIYRSLLDSLGVTAGFAPRADRALDILVGCPPELIIIDDILPDASGVDLTRRLRACPQLRDIPILAVCSGTSAAQSAALHQAGCTQIVAKPIQLEEFAAAVRRYLIKSEAQEPLPVSMLRPPVWLDDRRPPRVTDLSGAPAPQLAGHSILEATAQ
jgi:two-component system cell cycle response regulator DivK